MSKLTTLDTVKEELDITGTGEDARLTRYILEVSSEIESECGRTFEFAQGLSEAVPALGWKYITVPRYPVTTVNSITFAGQTVDADEYVVHSEEGMIFRANGWPWDTTLKTEVAGDKVANTEQSRIVVDYDGGYVTQDQDDNDATLTRNLPYDLEDVAIQLVVIKFRARGSSGAIQSEKLGDASVTYARGIRGIPDNLRRRLARYGEVY